jgi:hypothetical protein
VATRRSVEPGGEHLLEPTSSSLAIRGPCQPGCMLSGSETVPVPTRYARVDPWVISSDTEAEIAFLQTASTPRRHWARGCWAPTAASATSRSSSGNL